MCNVTQATNVKSEPQQRIHRLTNAYPPSSPFFGREPVRPLAMLTLQRIHSRHDDVISGCDDKPGIENKQQQPDTVTEDDGGNYIGADYGNIGESDDMKPPHGHGSTAKNITQEGRQQVTGSRYS